MARASNEKNFEPVDGLGGRHHAYDIFGFPLVFGGGGQFWQLRTELLHAQLLYDCKVCV